MTARVIDFNVVGADGQPVLDLTAKDVALKAGGRTREISFFRLVRPDRESPPDATIAAAPFATSPRLQCREKGAFGYLEIYGVGPGTQLKVVQELRTVRTVRRSSATRRPSLRGRPLTCGSHLRDSRSTRLPTGDIVMRALVSVDGRAPPADAAKSEVGAVIDFNRGADRRGPLPY